MSSAERPPGRSLRSESVLLASLAGVAFAVIVFVHPGDTYIDTRMDLYLDPARFLRDCLSTWVPGTGLGAANYNVGYLPVALVTWLGHVAGLPTWLVVRLWRFALVVVAAAGARRLLVDLTPEQPAGPVARVAAAVLYVANPYVVVGAATTPVLLPYALFPWLLVWVRRTFEPGHRLRAVCWVGLVFFAMGGINAGVVPAILVVAVVPLVLDAHLREGRRWRDLAIGLAGSLGVALLVSLYWIVGTAIALGTASDVADATEDPRTIATVSSYAETLRGLGSWLLYGGDALGPYRPGFVVYLDQPVVVVATFVLPVLAVLGAWLTTRRARRLLTAVAVLGLVLMVGGFPPSHPSPFGRVLFWTFDHVPLTLAFRTTSKAGALAMLGLALLAALGIEEGWRRWSHHAREWFVVAIAVTLGVSLAPVWFGNLLPGRLVVPDYWYAAAHDLDTRGTADNVLALPGETNALYRWRPLSVDDVASSLVHRNVVLSRSYPDGPQSSWRFMSDVQQGLGARLGSGRTLSAVAGYVGASDVLVRNDMIWEVMGALRPSAVVAGADRDGGLRPDALYGPAGLNTQSPSLANPVEARLVPLVRYAVTEPASAVRLYPTSRQLLVVGDGSAVTSAVWAGLLDGDRPFRLVAHTPASALRAALQQGGRLLLTDTNRRREVNVHRIDRSGPLVSAGTPVDQTLAIGTSDDQTVAAYDGIADVTASSSGSIFGPTAGGRPFLAVDGDRRTAWTTGDFGNGVGQWVQVDLAGPTSVSRVVLSRPEEAGAAVDRVEVSAGGQTVTAAFGSSLRAVARFDGPVTARTVRVTIASVQGNGNNQVGLSEVRVPGVHAVEEARLPETLTRLARDPSLAPVLARAPLDVLLTRSVIEGESSMNRSFTLPSAQRYTVQAQASGRPGDWRRCRTLLTVDGQRVRARAVPGAPRPTPDTTQVSGCGALALGSGSHLLATAAAPRVDRILLAARGSTATPSATVDDLTWSGTSAALSTTTPDTAGPSMLVLAQGLDPRWHASVDGHDLGAPVEMNGFAMGWQVPAGAHDVRIWFGPQARYRVALVVSGLAVLVLALVLVSMSLRGRLRNRRRATSLPPDDTSARPARVASGPESATASTWVRRVGARGAVVLVVCGFVGGLLGLAGAAVCVGLVAGRRVAPRRLLLGSLALALALPVVWVVGNVGRLSTYSVAVVSHNPAAQWCGLLLVVTLVCGVFLARPGEDEPR